MSHGILDTKQNDPVREEIVPYGCGKLHAPSIFFLYLFSFMGGFCRLLLA